MSNVWGKENRSNQERHIAKWKSKNIVGLNAVNIFRIKIPHTELRTYSDLPKKGVKWVSGLISGTYQFDLYITPESETNPVENRNDLPYIVLYSSQLQNKKWLIIFYQASNSIEIDSVKESLVLEMRDKNIDMSGDRMIALFDDGSSGNVPTMIECAYTISR